MTFSPSPQPDPAASPQPAGSGTFPRPAWWGEHGCRVAGQPGHVCLDVWGRPVEGSHPCVAEARAAMTDLFEQYRAVAS